MNVSIYINRLNLADQKRALTLGSFRAIVKLNAWDAKGESGRSLDR